MLRGLYTSALGMTTQMKRIDVVSNNLANVNTTGYKKDFVVSTSFEEALAKRTHDREQNQFVTTFPKPVGGIVLGVAVDEVYTDTAQGNLITTNGTYDMALSGSGFFTVNTTGRNGVTTEKYTRDGSFTIDANGYLVTTDGGRVQGQRGDILLGNTPGTVSFLHDGQVIVDGVQIDTLRIADFEDHTTLRKQADNYLTATNASRQKPFEGIVLQGSLEASNVNTVKEMVDLITINRAYEANSKVIQTIDMSLQRSVQEVGRKM